MTASEVRELLTDRDRFAAALEAWRAQEPVWSHTRLSAYVRCPLSFFLGYVLRLDEQPSPALARGAMLHTFAEDYARECYRRRRGTMYRWGREELASYPPEVREVGNLFIESTEFNWDLIVADGRSVERPFAVELPDGLGTFRGRCDLVQYNEFADEAIVTDYKSGRGPFTRPEECPAQLECYAWAMKQELGAKRIMAVYRYIANAVTHEWELSDPEPAWACSVVRRIGNDTRFEPVARARSCGWCGFRHLCPVLSDDPVCYPAEEEAAADLWREWRVTHARAASLKVAARDFIDARFLERLTTVPDLPGYYPPDPDEPAPRDVIGDPVAVVAAVVEGLGVEAAQRLFDGRRLAGAFVALGGEGFGDNPAFEALAGETEEREQASTWHDEAPLWWRREQIAAVARTREEAEENPFEEAPVADPDAEARKRLFDRARKLGTVTAARVGKHDPLTGHQLQQALMGIGLPAEDAAVLRAALVTAETPGMADYQQAWGRVGELARTGHLATALYEALCDAEGLSRPDGREEAAEAPVAAQGPEDDPFERLRTEDGLYACPVCGRTWDEQAAAYQCCAGGDEPEQEAQS